MKQALIVIDVQQGMFLFPEMQPHDGDGTVRRIAAVLGTAREAGVGVVFVQHDGGDGHPLAMDSPGFPFHEALAPLPSETVVVKQHCNAFQQTDLLERLNGMGIGHVTVCGMQTQYCVDTFVRAAVEHGLKVRLIADGHTTFDTAVLRAEQIIAHHNDVLGGSFATLTTADEIVFET